ncbi:dynein regulatory complex subunit 3 isoform X1 [Neolamprologus brichardi]|uniref:dynein regulatory complex subunit 3 isoform X1 n=1 Tax=Neolamprologus brichardi TaxID=32507 RepID=UPI0016437DA4|nr:dynein regulatory complex subunit 3 isoform X1 [Neolamprologus brichardi]
MSSEYIISEPTSMDKEILQHAVQEQFKPDHILRFPDASQIHFNEVEKLRLEYKNILRIDHLWDFSSLSKLELNNNAIEKIQGLDHLINLTWLNLSFNKIEKIEGLECVQKLEVLNLSNNKISVIENMDTLENLTHFFISNNLIGQLDNVLYLRKFKNLAAFNLFGNPFLNEGDYRFFIAAYFPKLMFLDSRILDQKTRKEATIKYHYVLEKMRLEELGLHQADEARQRHEAELKLHRVLSFFCESSVDLYTYSLTLMFSFLLFFVQDAFVEFLNGSSLFRTMFKDDPKAQTLHCAPGVDSLIQRFEHQMGELCTQLFERGLAEHKRRETEVKSFFSCQEKAVTDCQEKASQMLAKFNHEHKERTEELQQLSDPEVRKVKIDHCNDEINRLCKNLMTLEFQLVSEMEEKIKTFESRISDMVKHFSEIAQGMFSHCRDLEDDYYQKMQIVAAKILQTGARDARKEDLPDDVIMLFEDRDAVIDALATAHDNHLLKINDRETQLTTGISAWKEALIKGIRDEELKRNRMNISDIHRYVDNLREQQEELI